MERPLAASRPSQHVNTPADESSKLPSPAVMYKEQLPAQQSVRRVTVTIFLGILFNHIRRLLAPSVCQFLFYHPISKLKLARASPHYFLDSQYASGKDVVAWVVMLAGLALVRFAVRGGRTARGTGDVKSDERVTDEWRKRTVSAGWKEEVQDVFAVTLRLAAWEAQFAESCWAAANLQAYTTLLTSGVTEISFLRTLLQTQWVQLSLHLALFLRWMYLTVRPAITKAVLELRSGRPGRMMVYGGVIWGTGYLVRYSNKYFILLEMSDMLVTFAWMAMGVAEVVVRTVGSGRRKVVQRGETS